MQQLHEEEL
jgi:hypothetical protein